jgi:hypothetical protein
VHSNKAATTAVLPLPPTPPLPLPMPILNAEFGIYSTGCYCPKDFH